jgi:uncharacterized membrane protein
MTNLVVISFPNKENALKGAHELWVLESIGDISIYEKVMIRKSPTGEITQLETDTTEGLRISSGAAFGALIGIVGGPVGVLVGLLSGTLMGAAIESNYVVFTEDISTKIKDRLRPGTVAILAEINEESPVFVDNAVSYLDAKIFRSDIEYIYEEYEDRQIKEVDHEITTERKRLKTSIAADKSFVYKKLADLKEKRKHRIEKLGTKHRDAEKLRIINKIQKHKEEIFVLEQRLNKIEHHSADHLK